MTVRERQLLSDSVADLVGRVAQLEKLVRECELGLNLDELRTRTYELDALTRSLHMFTWRLE